MVRVEGVEPSSPVWKTGIMAVIPHPRINRSDYNKLSVLRRILVLNPDNIVYVGKNSRIALQNDLQAG